MSVATTQPETLASVPFMSDESLLADGFVRPRDRKRDGVPLAPLARCCRGGAWNTDGRT